ncbi:MAG TPA: hypothetical protein VK539_23880 [Myxococcaceae bacterium]|nr:hypothetical protein [Myxococcaceae bacterium]
MRSSRSLWCLAALCLSACSLITDFDPEGQPCDVLGRCLEGYVCRNNVCVESPGAGTDGGSLALPLCPGSEGCPEAASHPAPQAPAEAR